MSFSVYVGVYAAKPTCTGVKPAGALMVMVLVEVLVAVDTEVA